MEKWFAVNLEIWLVAVMDSNQSVAQLDDELGGKLVDLMESM
jgi:hypothetical protein